MNDISLRHRNRNRAMLIAIFALFFGLFALAGVLRFSGWRPAQMKNHGELLDPPADLREHAPTLIDGGQYDWRPIERTWRIVAAPEAGCDTPCRKLARELDTVWQLFGRRADRVHILWLGPLPEGVPAGRTWRMLRGDALFRERLPRVDDPVGPPVYVVDPNGFVILRYAPGFDPAHLHQDVTRLLKTK